jgi:hypothetical protein
MRFDVETSQDYRSFDGVGIGAIFLDDNGYPCIKIPDVRSWTVKYLSIYFWK